MHVLHLSDVLPPGLGGIETALSTLLDAMPDVRFTILASSAAARRCPRLPGNVSIRSLELQEILSPLLVLFPSSLRRNSGLITYPIHEWERRKRVAALNADLVHLHSFALFRYYFNLYSRLGGRGPRQVVDWLRRLDEYVPAGLFTDHSLFGGSRDQFDSLGNGLLVERLENIVCVEKSGKANVDSFAEERGLTIKTWWIPNPIDTTLFAPSPAPQTDRLIVGYAGRVEKEGIEHILHLVHDAPDWVEFRLALAGDDEARRRLERAIGSRQVRITWNTPNSLMPSFYASIHILLDPYHFGVTRTSLEALSCGRPVLRFARQDSPADVPEAISPIVGDTDPRQVFKRLSELRRKEDLESAGASARRFVEQHFSAARVAEAYRAVYDVVSSHSHP